MKTFKRVLYWVAQCTWGIVETILGMIVALVLLCLGNKPKKIAHTFYFNVPYGAYGWGGFSLGPVIVTCIDPSDHLLKHEYGHTIQNIILGPLMSLVVSIPSMCRYWLRELFRNEKHNLYNIIEITTAGVCIILFGVAIGCLTASKLLWLFWLSSCLAIYLMCLASFIAFEYFTYKHKGLTEYDSIWIEGTATKLGQRFAK